MVIKACDEIIERMDDILSYPKINSLTNFEVYSQSRHEAQKLKELAQYPLDGTVYLNQNDMLLIGEYLPKPTKYP